MGTVWITFATEDNVDGDIDYLAQEISRSGWKTRMHPMFPNEDEKIDRLIPAFLSKPEQSDAWILYASPRALAGGRAERIQSAIDKALSTRTALPRIALLPQADVQTPSMTHRIRVDDPLWRQQLGEALECNLETSAQSEGLPPYVAKLQTISEDSFRYSFEFRPKMGRWEPFLFAIPPEDRSRVAPEIQPSDLEEGFSDDAEWYYLLGHTPATPTTSYVVKMKDTPSRLAFGQQGTDEVVILNLKTKN